MQEEEDERALSLLKEERQWPVASPRKLSSGGLVVMNSRNRKEEPGQK